MTLTSAQVDKTADWQWQFKTWADNQLVKRLISRKMLSEFQKMYNNNEIQYKENVFSSNKEDEIILIKFNS